MFLLVQRIAQAGATSQTGQAGLQAQVHSFCIVQMQMLFPRGPHLNVCFEGKCVF